MHGLALKTIPLLVSLLLMLSVCLPSDASLLLPIQAPINGQNFSGPIEAGDSLKVKVVGGDVYSGIFVVDSDGEISIPRLGVIIVGKLTPVFAAERMVARIIQLQLLKRPSVTVEIVGRVDKEVVVGGVVAKPGPLKWKTGLHLSDVLDAATPAISADLSRVQISRAGATITIDFRKYVAGQGSASDVNPLMEPSDRVYVFSGEQLSGVARIIGEIRDQKLTVIMLTSRTSFAQAIQQGGGLSDLADAKRIVIRRDNKDIAVNTSAVLRGDTGADILLQDGDVIVVPKLLQKQEAFVSGAIRNGGAVSLSTPVTVLQAIAQTGGLLDTANRRKIMLRRQTQKSMLETMVLNIDIDTEAATMLQSGDVVEVPFRKRSSQFDFNRIAGSVIAAVSLINIFRK